MLYFLLNIVFFLFLIATLVQFGYWILVFSKLIFYKKNQKNIVPNETKSEIPVSVVICAHNEEKKLQLNLYRILTQCYHSFEVIVVDDHSVDNSLSILYELQKKFSYLRIIKNTYIKNNVGKKEALALGISAAKHDILLLTDADCIPDSEFWIRDMMAALDTEKKMVLGFSPYQKIDGQSVNIWIRFEAIYTALQYMSFAICKIPYMGVGRNLLYNKDLYIKNNGFEAHRNIVSGDDDLFVNAAANAQNVAISLAPNTFVTSAPKETWGAYIRQKRRHFTTGKHYKLSHQLLLAALAASHCGHYGGAFILLLSGSHIELIVLIYLARLMLVTIGYNFVFQRFQDPSLRFWTPILDLGVALYYAILSPAIWIGNNRTWN